MTDAELIDAALNKWSEEELAAGREPNASRFAREVIIRDARSLRRWRGGYAALPDQLRDWCRVYLGLAEWPEEPTSGNR